MGEGVQKMGEEIVAKVASKTHIPFYGVILIVLVVLGVLVAIFYLCCQRWWKKLRGDRGKGMMVGKVDIKSVQLLGQTYKEKVSDTFPDKQNVTISTLFNINLFLIHPGTTRPGRFNCKHGRSSRRQRVHQE